MENLKHTKGEWKYHQTFRGDYSININDESIANVWCLENDENYTDEANAKLIAAAPDLLDSLIDIQNNADVWDNLFLFQKKKINNAIRKATE